MDLNNYFKTIATEHIDILHDDLADNKGYFRSYSSATILLDNEFHKKLRWVKDNAIISQFNDDAQLPTPDNDFPWQTPSGTLYVLSRIIDSDVETARLKAVEIRNDIISRIKYDAGNNTIYKSLQLSSIQSQSVGRIADNFYCVALFISFNEVYKNPYNANKWQALS